MGSLHQNISSKIEIPSGIFESQELVEEPNGDLVPGSRPIGTNKVGMVAWVVTMKTPEYPEGRDVVVIANDVTVKSGSFGVEEDEIFYKASKYARENKLPRVYIACNAGARIGLFDDLKSKIKIKFSDRTAPPRDLTTSTSPTRTTRHFQRELSLLTRSPKDGPLMMSLELHGIGVENLQGSGKIAGETSRAYDEIFTLSYVTGRSVGIGAYLVRLGQRVIQKKLGPIILTGYSALNKLLGREVYTSQDQLGGPQIMVPNGVTHEASKTTKKVLPPSSSGSALSPRRSSSSCCRDTADPVDRAVEWRPTPTPYDPRLMMAGTKDMPGFFDQGSFKEYLAGWGKSVVVGRGRLGGIPMGAIAVETRLVDKVIPADPADPNSRESCPPPGWTSSFPRLVLQDRTSSFVTSTRKAFLS